MRQVKVAALAVALLTAALWSGAAAIQLASSNDSAPEEPFHLEATWDAEQQQLQHQPQAEATAGQKTGPTFTALDSEQVKKAAGLNIDLAALEKRTADSIRGIDDHPVQDTPEARTQRMLEALLELPREEQERMQLDAILALDPSERPPALQALWERRQAELKEIYAGMPTPAKILGSLIAILRSEASGDAVLLDALLDLEDHLSDVDMARDFHTLGGWHPLQALLHAERAPAVREHAAWVIGTAVKNVIEFHGWALETGPAAAADASESVAAADALESAAANASESAAATDALESGAATDASEGGAAADAAVAVAGAGDGLNAIDRLLECVADARHAGLQGKALYALASALRHNARAQAHFVTTGGLDALRNAAATAADDGGAAARGLLTKAITLVSDIVADEAHEEGSGGGAVAAGVARDERWCVLLHALLLRADAARGGTQLERALDAALVLAPLCGARPAGVALEARLAAMHTELGAAAAVAGSDGDGDGDGEYAAELLEKMRRAEDALQGVRRGAGAAAARGSGDEL
ncbi:hypothetical protein JKP88DRAFT_304075 [Tribonema minus]|uniref:Nucleotide exchange factor Fes1 domain-containing protein n=1 Tax=Tribonema minus TaxID=303371 RepID=A0A835Z7K3_9STRA|nr:hypothetical protein JKP88DRAFT_304075 [Tribonema minus]